MYVQVLYRRRDKTGQDDTQGYLHIFVHIFVAAGGGGKVLDKPIYLLMKFI
jgi:hypothetical protein